MRYFLSTVLVAVALFALVASSLVALSLPRDFAELDREPEDFYLTLFWGLVALVVFFYCAFGAAKGFGNRQLQIGRLGVIMSGLIFGIGFLMLVETMADRTLLVPGVLVVIAPVAYVGLSRVKRENPQDVVPTA